MSQSDRSPSHHSRLRIRQGGTLAAVLLLAGLDAPWPTAAANAGPCNVSCQERCGKVLDGFKQIIAAICQQEHASCMAGCN